MVMEYLSRLFIKASKEKGFKPHPHCRKTKLMHLMYADDLIVLSTIDPRTVKIIMEAFGKFSNSTGLAANKAKSQVVLGGAVRKRCRIYAESQGSKREQCPLDNLGYISQLTS